MVKKYSEETRRQVVKLWLEGHSYRKISEILNMSTGTISSIIAEEKEKVTDIEELRRLNIRIKKLNSTVIEAIRGEKFLNKMNEALITFNDIEKCLDLVSRYEEKAEDVLQWGKRLKELEISKGKPYEEIVYELDENYNRLIKTKQEINEMTNKKKSLKKELEDLEDLKNLQQKINIHGVTHDQLSLLIEQNTILMKLGFTSRTANLFASQLRPLGLDPDLAAAKMTDLISQHGTLENAVSDLENERNSLRMDIKIKTSESEAIQKEISHYQEQLSNLQDLINDAEKTYKRYMKHIEDLEKRKAGLKIEERNIKNELTKAQITLATFEGKMNRIKPIGTIISLLTKPETFFDLRPVFEILLGMMNSLKTNINKFPNNVSDPLKLTKQVDVIIQELSREIRYVPRKIF